MTAPAAALDRPGEDRVYPVPLDTGEIIEHPSATAAIGVTSPKHLTDWRLKMALLGVALREDIAVRVAAAHLLPAGKERNSELRQIAEDAIGAGQIIEKGHRADRRGTAYHALTERIDDLVLTGPVQTVDELGLPKAMADIARAYVDAMAGVRVLHSETTCVNRSEVYAGTPDRIIAFEPLDEFTAVFDQYELNRGCFVFDAKFGKVHDTVAMQLAAAANAEGMWNPATGELTPMPADLRRDVGFVFNPDQGLVPVDLTGAYEAFLGALAVKHYQDRRIRPLHPALKIVRGGDAGTPTVAGATSAPTHISEVLPQAIAAVPDEPAPADEFLVATTFPGAVDDATDQPVDPHKTKRAWLKDQYDALVAMGERGIAALQAHWPADVPNMRQADEQRLLYSASQLAAIEAALDLAGTAARAPFPEPDPTDPAFKHVDNDDPRVLALIERGTQLPDDLAQNVFRAFKENGVRNLRTGNLSEKQLLDADEIIASAEAMWAPRLERITNALTVATTSSMVAERTVLRALGVEEPRQIVGPLVDRLDALADALNLGVLVSSEDGQAILVADKAVFDMFNGSEQAVWDAARLAAKAHELPAPTSADDALSSPLLVALFCAA